MLEKDSLQFKIVSAVLLFSVLLILAVYGIKRVKPAKTVLTERPGVKKTTLAIQAPLLPQAPSEVSKAQESEGKSAELRLDPFTAETIAAAEKPVVATGLNGILWDSRQPLAIINNKVVKKGDKIAGNVVVNIKEDRVILSDGSNLFELRIEKEEE